MNSGECRNIFSNGEYDLMRYQILLTHSQQQPFSWLILLKLAGNVKIGKNRISLYLFFFSLYCSKQLFKTVYFH